MLVIMQSSRALGLMIMILGLLVGWLHEREEYDDITRTRKEDES